MDWINISGIHGVKEYEQGKWGVYVTVVIVYKTDFVVNIQPLTFPFPLGEGVE